MIFYRALTFVFLFLLTPHLSAQDRVCADCTLKVASTDPDLTLFEKAQLAKLIEQSRKTLESEIIKQYAAANRKAKTKRYSATYGQEKISFKSVTITLDVDVPADKASEALEFLRPHLSDWWFQCKVSGKTLSCIAPEIEIPYEVTDAQAKIIGVPKLKVVRVVKCDFQCNVGSTAKIKKRLMFFKPTRGIKISKTTDKVKVVTSPQETVPSLVGKGLVKEEVQSEQIPVPVEAPEPTPSPSPSTIPIEELKKTIQVIKEKELPKAEKAVVASQKKVREKTLLKTALPPKSAAVLLDSSGSMQGAPLEKMKLTFLDLMSRLKSKQTLDLYVIQRGLMVHHQKGKTSSTKTIRAVKEMKAEGGSAIKEELLRALKDPKVEEIFIFTDNRLTDEDDAIELVRTAFQNSQKPIRLVKILSEYDKHFELITEETFKDNAYPKTMMSKVLDAQKTFLKEISDIQTIEALRAQTDAYAKTLSQSNFKARANAYLELVQSYYREGRYSPRLKKEFFKGIKEALSCKFSPMGTLIEEQAKKYGSVQTVSVELIHHEEAARLKNIQLDHLNDMQKYENLRRSLKAAEDELKKQSPAQP